MFHNFDIDVHWQSQYLDWVSTSTFKHKKSFMQFHKQHLNTVSPSEIGAKKITNIEDHCEFWISFYIDVKILFSALCQGRRPRRGCPLSSLLLMSAATKTMETGAQIVEQRCSLSALPTCEHHQALPLAHAHFFLLLYLDQAWRKIVVWWSSFKMKTWNA